ncbi:hypothetical protein PsorP6_004462 [Peronosclerospora sorghi]|uniref:Uncharacterized protein n=1 Tax=Peronosclerospora sorghi TaxID=230839 RepID=A0ACC0VKW2_9STRA|nr:hypothetical protein PsorP6_004462 [Peronosclerospora sorghi]
MPTTSLFVLLVTLLGVSTALDVQPDAVASILSPILGDVGDAFYEDSTSLISTDVVANTTLLRRLQPEGYSFQTDLLAAVNRERAAHGLRGLCMNWKLQKAAQNHAKDMAIHNFMGHTGSNGWRPTQRIKSASYALSSCGENVAAGQVSVAAVMKMWMASPHHRDNILRPQFTMFGCGSAYSKTSYYKYYWAQDFGSSETERCS